MDNLLELRNISKEFPGVKALNNVCLDIRKGEVLALVGENGAGKSTLIKILTGAYQCSEGEIIWEGKPVRFSIPQEAQRAGIATIYQELTLCPNLTIAENIFLGREITQNGILNNRQMEEQASQVLRNLGVNLDPGAEVATITVANQQLVEISRALIMDAKLLIMDEPTSSLSEHEVKALFIILKQLVAKGISILFISHKFNEIFELSDRISILRDGEYIDTLDTANADQDRIISLMVGRSVDTMYPKRSCNIGEVIFAARGLRCAGKFENISFELRKGEILGFAGLVGAGRTEVFESIFGLRALQSGEIFIDGEWRATPRNVVEAMQLGIGLLPEDRKQKGLNLLMNVGENISLSWMCTDESKLVINMRQEHVRTNNYINSLNIKTPTSTQLVMNLSGGNQQKVVVAKWLATKSRVLIFDEPTRGIDVGAKAEIYQLMNSLVEEGYSIIMVSSELPEIVGMSDKVVVMHEGIKTAELSENEINAERIMYYATMANKIGGEEILFHGKSTI